MSTTSGTQTRDSKSKAEGEEPTPQTQSHEGVTLTTADERRVRSVGPTRICSRILGPNREARGNDSTAPPFPGRAHGLVPDPVEKKEKIRTKDIFLNFSLCRKSLLSFQSC
jgi:hypothetical protein